MALGCSGSPDPRSTAATPAATRGASAGETDRPGEPTAAGPRNLTGTLDPTFIGGLEVAGMATDGRLAWITDADRDLVVAVDLGAGSIIDEFEVGASPLGIAQFDGSLWVANASPGDHRVMRLDAATGVVQATIGIPAGRTTTGIALGHGAAWVATSESGELVRIGQVSAEIEATIADQSITATGTVDVLVAFDAVWTIDHLSGSVLRIDPTTNSIAERYPDLGRQVDGEGSDSPGPLRLAADEGRVWVLSGISRGRLATGLFTIDPASGSSELVAEIALSPDPNGLPALLIDSAGGAWFSVDERLVRLAIAERRLDTIEADIALRFSAIVQAGDHVWYGMASSFDEDLTGLYGVELARITTP